ncbi:DDE_Tnp_1_7 domain-containing protein [Trichonephila clavipes]|nr:DDE_Tnp_1_7 domain-containing protein [Trichonephila clavipes]
MPNKPDKFGIKFWLASDISTKYIINGFPYLEKGKNRGASTPLKEFVVLKLPEPFTGCGRSITTDNFLTSASLATKLLEKKNRYYWNDPRKQNYPDYPSRRMMNTTLLNKTI